MRVGFLQAPANTNRQVRTPRMKVPYGQFVVCPLMWLGFKTPKPVGD